MTDDEVVAMLVRSVVRSHGSADEDVALETLFKFRRRIWQKWPRSERTPIPPPLVHVSYVGRAEHVG